MSDAPQARKVAPDVGKTAALAGILDAQIGAISNAEELAVAIRALTLVTAGMFAHYATDDESGLQAIDGFADQVRRIYRSERSKKGNNSTIGSTQ